MNKRTSLFWLVALLFLSLAFKFTRASSDGQDFNFEEEIAAPFHDAESDTDDDTGPHAQGQDDMNLDDAVSLPESVYLNIIAEISTELPRDILPFWTLEQIQSILEKSFGAPLIAARADELFAHDLNAIEVDLIHPSFFHRVRIFNEISDENLAKIPPLMMNKIIEAHSSTGSLNLNKLIEKFHNLDPMLSFTISTSYQLPHLFNVPDVINPEYYMVRGISFNPDNNWNQEDYVIWNISLQLLLRKFAGFEEFRSCDAVSELKPIILQELSNSSNNSIFDRCNINYFRIEENSVFPLAEIFPSHSLTLEEAGIDLNALFASTGLGDFSTLDYNALTSDKKIIYRLLAYVVLSNPGLMPESEFNSFISNLVKSAHADDFSASEIDFFVRRCYSRRLGDLIGTIFRSRPNSRFTRLMETRISSRQESFSLIVSSTTNAAHLVPLIRRWSRSLIDGISISNEKHFKTSQRKKLSGSSSLNFDSHFLTNDQLKKLIISYNPNGKIIKFSVPCPDKDFLNARLDNWMQNLDSNDFGETAWRARLSKLSESKREEMANNDATLIEFVRRTFRVVHYMMMNPDANVQVVFDDSPGVGDGPKLEALEMFSRAILLPSFKVFYYNPKIIGFVPYPLLHPKIMAVLGYLNGWFVVRDIPISWSFSPDFIKFLFYEENTEESMQQVIEHFYGPLFANIDSLLNQNTNPLDYFPTAFHTHKPLTFGVTRDEESSPLDLFAPFDSTASKFSHLSTFLDSTTLDFIDEIIILPKSKNCNLQESKEEDFQNLVESKSDDDIDDSEYLNALERLNKQMKIKRDIVEAIKLTVSQEIIEHLMTCRFSFIHEFLKFFNTFSTNHINAKLYKQLQDSFNPEITVQDLLEGFDFKNERLDVQVIVSNTSELLTPRQTLTRILETFDANLLKTFYWFCTGCTSIPLGGLANNPIKINVISGLLLLPASHTCFRTLDFYIQKTLTANISAMRMALLECSGYQYIETRDQIPADSSAEQAILNALENAASNSDNSESDNANDEDQMELIQNEQEEHDEDQEEQNEEQNEDVEY